MSSFDDRKDAFENKFAHDAELQFKVEARTCKLFGLWVAEQLGLNGDEADVYAKEVVSANLSEAGFGDVKRKVHADLQAKEVEISDHLIDRQLEKYTEEAKKQVMEAAGF